MIFSAESRWFFSGRVPDEMDNWFSAGSGGDPDPKAMEERNDRYLMSRDCDRVGVKLRGGLLLEVKTGIGTAERLVLAPGIEGYLETFLKWSCEDRSVAQVAGDDPRPWVSVRKNRSLSTTALPAGCHAELTRVDLGSVPFWTFALEAIGSPEDARGLLQECALRFVELHGIPPVALTLERSLSYPAWLAGSSR